MKLTQWIGLIVWISLAGCTAPPAITPTVGLTAAPPTQAYHPPTASSAAISPASPPALKLTRTNQPSPEWSRPAAMKTPASYANTIENARQDLARRLKLDLTDVQFVRLTADEFPADTLGCLGPGVTPRPIPAMVSGQTIILQAAGVRYTYHARREQVVFCGP